MAGRMACPFHKSACSVQAMRLYPLSIFRDYALRIFPRDWSPAYWAARVLGAAWQNFIVLSHGAECTVLALQDSVGKADKDFTCVMRRVVHRYHQNGGIAFWYSWQGTRASFPFDDQDTGDCSDIMAEVAAAGCLLQPVRLWECLHSLTCSHHGVYHGLAFTSCARS